MAYSVELHNVYIQGYGSCGGKKESKGPLGALLDKQYKNSYAGCKTFEDGEVLMSKTAITYALNRAKIPYKNINMLIGGDLTNQLAVSNYVAKNYPFSFIGTYGACSTIIKSIAIASIFIDSKIAENIITFSSSSCEVAERQFRYPNDYGYQKRDTTTITATGAASFIIGKRKTKIRVDCCTIGQVYDPKHNDVNDMGSPMAFAAYHTIKDHLKYFQKSPDDYDEILTGDLSSVGSKVLKQCLKEEGINIKNHKDAGIVLFERKKEQMYAGGSGSACVGLVLATDIMKRLINGDLKRVLIVGTGALFSPTFVQQKKEIPVVAHAIELSREDDK